MKERARGFDSCYPVVGMAHSSERSNFLDSTERRGNCRKAGHIPTPY